MVTKNEELSSSVETISPDTKQAESDVFRLPPDHSVQPAFLFLVIYFPPTLGQGFLNSEDTCGWVGGMQLASPLLQPGGGGRATNRLPFLGKERP